MAKRTASAKKQARAGVRRAARNRGVRSEVKTRIAKARRSFTESPVAEADRAALAIDAISALDRAAAKGILHRGNAARRKARLIRQLLKVGGLAAMRSAAVASQRKKEKPPPAPKAPEKRRRLFGR